MHFHLPVAANEILWMLTFACHLVLLVVLMGRDRIRTFPFFTASIVLITLRLLAAHMLSGKLPQMTMAAVFIVLADLGAIITALMLYEIARKAFRGVKRSLWIGSTLALLLAGAIVLAAWGEWPAWKTLTASGAMPALQLLQFLALKASLLLDIETVLLGLVIVIFGARYQGGWRTHVQRIVIGLATASLAQLAMQAIWEYIASHAKPASMAEYQHFIDLREHLFNANSAIYVAVLLWWIWSLWQDEPKTAEPGTAKPVAETPAPPELPATLSQPDQS
jgi:hypothetical protein